MAEFLNRKAQESLSSALARLGLHIADLNGSGRGEAPGPQAEPFEPVASAGREPLLADDLPTGDLDDFRKE